MPFVLLLCFLSSFCYAEKELSRKKSKKQSHAIEFSFPGISSYSAFGYQRSVKSLNLGARWYFSFQDQSYLNPGLFIHYPLSHDVLLGSELTYTTTSQSISFPEGNFSWDKNVLIGFAVVRVRSKLPLKKLWLIGDGRLNVFQHKWVKAHGFDFHNRDKSFILDLQIGIQYVL